MFFLQPQNAGLLQLHLLRGVPRLLGLLERLEGFVVLAPLGVRAAEEERGERAFGQLQLLDRLRHVAEVEVDDAELEVEFFSLGRLGGGELFGERVVDFLERPDLRPALGQPLAELRHHAAFELLALDQKGAEVDVRLGHGSGIRVADRALPRVGKHARTGTSGVEPKCNSISGRSGGARRGDAALARPVLRRAGGGRSLRVQSLGMVVPKLVEASHKGAAEGQLASGGTNP